MVFFFCSRDLIQKIRDVVKAFKKSPLKNNGLQNYIKGEFGRELQLTLDCRTRWSSLAAMIARFNQVKHCVFKALIDLKLTGVQYSFSEENCQTLTAIEKALEPVKLAVNVLCREDASWLTAETTLRFMVSKLEMQNTGLSKELRAALLHRIKERRNSMSGVLLYLENPNKYLEQVSGMAEGDAFFLPNRTTIRQEVKCLIERLLEGAPLEDATDTRPDLPSEPEIPSTSATNSFEDELEQSLRTEWLVP